MKFDEQLLLIEYQKMQKACLRLAHCRFFDGEVQFTRANNRQDGMINISAQNQSQETPPNDDNDAKDAEDVFFQSLFNCIKFK